MHNLAAHTDQTGCAFNNSYVLVGPALPPIHREEGSGDTQYTFPFQRNVQYKLLLGGVDAVNKLHVYTVSYQLRVDNVLPATSLGLNSRVWWQKAVLKL